MRTNARNYRRYNQLTCLPGSRLASYKVQRHRVLSGATSSGPNGSESVADPWRIAYDDQQRMVSIVSGEISSFHIIELNTSCVD